MTSVEFLYKALEHIRIDRSAKRISAEQAINSRAEVLESAKEMEKQQIIDANNAGYKVGRKDIKFETAEQYYHETYEG